MSLPILKPSKLLPREFYLQKTRDVAKQLLGKLLVHDTPTGLISGYITETEAYVGVKDKACHGYGGRSTKRVQSLYLEGGHSYVFQIYGLHFCFNVVTYLAGDPQAVLIRGIHPVHGLKIMKKNRCTENLKILTNGPGKVCEAMGITKQQDGWDLLNSPLRIYEGLPSPRFKTTPRIGIDYAEEWVAKPLRYIT